MARKYSVGNPGGGEASREAWERYTWLSISKECHKRGYFPATSAYDEKGLLRESACPDLHHHVYVTYYSAVDAMPVIKLKHGVVVIEWTTAKQHERQQRIADNSYDLTTSDYSYMS
ncbi:unnamed protein product [Aureobasidium uvarum]|uniref:Uncharacterized protein n=1 Tax=Aureobasidium uvarum TaxID=2773716 RepID=A0A9N8KG48_9PEZI|nr:unnamed protein product [Aureobasidium uvarum]